MKGGNSLVVALTLAAAGSAAWLPRNADGKNYLDTAGLSQNNKALFNYAMPILDSNFGLPLLWGSPKVSSWYAVGLLARNEGDDVQVANKLIANILTKQYTDPTFAGYGTFIADYRRIYADAGSLYAPVEYTSYDPNNALFVTIAGIIIDSQFSHLLDPTVHENLRKAMHTAVVGDGYRVGGVGGDNLYTAYSNPWYMRCASAAYVGSISGDANMTYWAEKWTQEAVDLFDEYGTLSEFNGGTYAGVTLFAMSLAQYLPKNTTLYKEAPRLMAAIWEQIGETYNPSLTTLAGPWDRTYGFDLTQYYGILGSAITGIIGMSGKYPMPKPLDGAEHYTDMAIIPMQMLTAPYVESAIPSSVKSKLSALYGSHYYTAQSIYPPYETRPRNYSFWVEDGLSAGGIEFDENVVGGPSINQPSFSPGVILWGAGKNGAGAGWISYYPSNPSCSIVATSSNLTIRYLPSLNYPNGTLSNRIQLSIASQPDFQLSGSAFDDGTASLPGLDVVLSGNAIQQGNRTLSYGATINDLYYYNLTYTFPASIRSSGEVPELVISWTKTTPPTYDLILE